MLDSKSSLTYLYPNEFEQCFLNKKKYWMGIPILPPLDIKLIKYIFNKYKDELTEEEKNRNIYK
jgi:5'-3' exonuclease